MTGANLIVEPVAAKKKLVSNTDKGVWMEIKLQGKLPERRSNHTAFICENSYYVHGGRDLKEGSLDNLWKLDLNGITDLQEDPNFFL